MSKATIGGRIFVFSLIALALIISYSEAAQDIPDTVKEMVLKDLGFYNPIEKSLTSQLFVSTATMGSAIFEHDAEVTGKGAKTRLWMRKFFIPNDYLKKLPTKSEQGRFDWGEYMQMTGEGIKDLVPTEKFRPHLRKTQDGMVIVTLANRVIRSIDYTKKWKLNDLDAWSFTFTYFLEPVLPELPQLGPFKGKGTAMMNPATGEFATVTEKDVGRLYGSTLGDTGDREYTSWLEKQSIAESEKLPAKSNKSQDSADCSKDRSEEAKTGKPMCKKYWPQEDPKTYRWQPFKKRR